MIDFEKYINTTVKDIPPSGIRRFFDLANEMEGVISLGVGEPDFDTPWHIREAGIRSIEEGRTAYTANQGLFSLRKEICQYHERRFNVHYNPKDNIVITVGGSEAIDIAMRALINEGDEVIMLSPGYVAYEPSIRLAKGTPKLIELKRENEFKLTPEALEATITNKTKVMLINFPSNPTGGVMTYEDYQKIVPIIKKHEILVISDEIYAELSYDQPFASLANFPEVKDQIIVINGFSKAFAMTGWRLGYVLAHKTLTQAMNKIHQYVIMSAPTASQYAAVEAMRHGQQDVQVMRESYLARRNFIVNGFNKLGLDTFTPQGAFYVFPCIKSTGLSSDEFCEALLASQKVACVPGSAFGKAGEGFIRVSYAYSIEHIKEALIRIEAFLNELKNK